MDLFWKEIRKDFPATRKLVYLDHAAAGLIIPKAEEAVRQYYREHAEEGDLAWPKWMRRREEVRQKAARFINAEPEEIAFTQSTSHGMNLAAEILAGQGRVLTNNSEFPSSTVPWICRKASMIWQRPEAGMLSLTKLRSLLSPSVKTILTSYVQYATGFRQDLTALGKAKGKRFFVVNATQGFGAFPVDVQKWNADFLVTNSYKWLMAGYGGGLLFIRKKWVQKFKSQSLGWRSIESPDSLDNKSVRAKQRASRYELGCPSFPAIFALGAAIDYLSQIGLEKIQARILDLTQFLRSTLRQSGFEVVLPEGESHLSGITVVRTANASLIWKKLQAEKICVSARGEGIRAAVHFYNNFEDIEKFVKRLKSVRGFS